MDRNDKSLNDRNFCYAQLLWLAKSEPEPFLQPLLNDDGNVATKHLGDLRESDNYLRQPDFGAHEAEVPEFYGRTGADNVSHWGQAKLLVFLSFISSGPSRLQCLWDGHHHCEHLLWRINCARWHHNKNPISNHTQPLHLRVREVAQDDLAGLHLWLWRLLWTLSWD